MTGPSPGNGYVRVPSSGLADMDDDEQESSNQATKISHDDQGDDTTADKPLLTGSTIDATCPLPRDNKTPTQAAVDDSVVSQTVAERAKDELRGTGSEARYRRLTYTERMGIVATVPHLVVLLAVVVLTGYTGLNIRSENARQLTTEDLEKRSAFVYLVTPNVTDIGKLGVSIQSVNRYFKTDLKYQIVVIHEGVAPVEQGRLQALSIAPLRFREYGLRGPFDSNVSSRDVTGAETMRWKRHHEARFWFRTAVLAEAAKRGIFDDLDYVIRLAADSVVTGVVTRDVIREFVLSGAQYGYRSIGKDCRRNETYGVREVARSYVELNGITPRSMNLWANLMRGKGGGCVPCFEDRFEMMNMRFFRSHSGIQDWVRVVDANGGIYRHGWGEAALRYATIALYAAPEKLVRYGNDVVPLR